MIRVLELNVEKSYELYLKTKDIIQQAQCYNNCINILSRELLFDYLARKYKIGYCYVGGDKHLLVRHCVIIDEEDNLIDVSIFLKYILTELEEQLKTHSIQYFIFAELSNQELFDLIEQEDLRPELKNGLKVQEKELYDFVKNTNLEFNVFDYCLYISYLIK